MDFSGMCLRSIRRISPSLLLQDGCVSDILYYTQISYKESNVYR